MRVDSHVTTLWNWFSCFTGLINLVHICSGVGMYKLKLWFKKNSLKQTGQALFVKSTEHTQRSTGFKPSKITLDKQKNSSEVQVMVAYLLGCFGGLRNFWMKEMKNYYLLLLTLSYTVPSVWISSTIVVHTSPLCLSIFARPDSGVSGEVALEPSSTTWICAEVQRNKRIHSGQHVTHRQTLHPNSPTSFEVTEVN